MEQPKLLLTSDDQLFLKEIERAFQMSDSEIRCAAAERIASNLLTVNDRLLEENRKLRKAVHRWNAAFLRASLVCGLLLIGWVWTLYRMLAR